MQTADIDTFVKHRLAPVRQQVQLLLRRSATARSTALLLIHAAGCALMLAAPLISIVAGAGVVQLYNSIRGPLDWFLIEVLCAAALFSAYLSVQLFSLKPATPAGVCIDPSSEPELHDMLARRASHFKVPVAGNIVLTTQAELRIVATPMWPVPLGHRFTLCAGAPLLLFCTRAQLRLAMAGAVASAAADRSRLDGRLQQACADWPLILASVSDADNLLARLLVKPLQHIVDASDALGAPLRDDWRRQLGRWVLENSDEKSAGDFLANQIVAAAFLQKQYWPMILKAAERCPTPVVKAFSHLPLLLDKTLNRQLAKRWLIQAQTAGEQHKTGVRDLLAEFRIEHLRWTGRAHPSAFEALFKSATILKQLDQFWQRDIEPEWRRRHARFQNDRIRFTQLEKRAASEDGLRAESALRYIRLVPHFLEMPETLSRYSNVYNNNRDDPKVCFAAGLALLRAGATDEGRHAVERAADLEPGLAKRVKAIIKEHHQAAWASGVDLDTQPAREGYA